MGFFPIFILNGCPDRFYLGPECGFVPAVDLISAQTSSPLADR